MWKYCDYNVKILWWEHCMWKRLKSFRKHHCHLYIVILKTTNCLLTFLCSWLIRRIYVGLNFLQYANLSPQNFSLCFQLLSVGLEFLWILLFLLHHHDNYWFRRSDSKRLRFYFLTPAFILDQESKEWKLCWKILWEKLILFRQGILHGALHIVHHDRPRIHLDHHRACEVRKLARKLGTAAEIGRHNVKLDISIWSLQEWSLWKN